jgi:hypothetical protein
MNNNFAFIIGKNQANEHIRDLSNYIDHLYTDNETLRKQLDEWNKDEEIQKLKNELQQLRSENCDQTDFSISKDELETCRKWEEKHIKEKHKGQNFGCIGGNYSYVLTPTSIGMSGYIKCSCGDTFTFREL